VKHENSLANLETIKFRSSRISIEINHENRHGC